MSNSARDTLRLDRNPLLWDEWGEHFQDNMPEEISAGLQRDHKDSNKDRLKTLRNRYKLSRYKRTPSGDVNSRPPHRCFGATSAALGTGPVWRFDQLLLAHQAMDENRANGKMVVVVE